jgi:hypothetical protein
MGLSPNIARPKKQRKSQTINHHPRARRANRAEGMREMKATTWIIYTPKRDASNAVAFVFKGAPKGKGKK